jgi:hypothetical protein
MFVANSQPPSHALRIERNEGLEPERRCNSIARYSAPMVTRAVGGAAMV